MHISPSREINVLWVAESNWVTGSGIKAHSHDYYHMFIVRQGPLSFTVDGKRCRLEKGEALLAQPGAVHSLDNVSVHMGRVYEIKFTTQSPVLRDLLSSLPVSLPASTFAEALVQELMAESCLQDPSTPTFVSDYLLSLIDFYSRCCGKPRKHETAIIDTTGYSRVSTEIVQYLESHYDREVPLQEIADAVGFNKNYICSVFKRDSGMTIGSCQTAIRIRKAAEMISFSDMSLAQVSASTGFTNLSHFNRIFKKVVGIPPGHYRRMYTANLLDINTLDNEKALQETIGMNGFIISVLGRKKLSISEIIEENDSDNTEELA